MASFNHGRRQRRHAREACNATIGQLDRQQIKEAEPMDQRLASRQRNLKWTCKIDLRSPFATPEDVEVFCFSVGIRSRKEQGKTRLVSFLSFQRKNVLGVRVAGGNTRKRKNGLRRLEEKKATTSHPPCARKRADERSPLTHPAEVILAAQSMDLDKRKKKKNKKKPRRPETVRPWERERERGKWGAKSIDLLNSSQSAGNREHFSERRKEKKAKAIAMR